MIKILAISGSLRAASSNTALLHAASMLAPRDVEIAVYDGLGALPLFNPDLEKSAPSPVTDFRARVRGADGLLIASPEYAHGVTGAMKNALDWLVGGDEFVGKPVALFNASPRAIYAQAALAETLRTMTARIVPAASIAVPLLGRQLDAAAIAAHPEFSHCLKTAIAAFTRAIEAIRADTN